ncbi:MAG: winged helix-turn-helix transcriptional regulator [candidate division Zixibacteria bacterium]|nr:winged helix-turn-helix transcriptional regulator [candidate division Zixibacteria bacterium]
MKTIDMTKYEIRARVIKAMAHPTRLCIVDMLSQQDMCVAELTKIIGADMSTVSKHLSILKNAGIITSAKKGTQVNYSLHMHCVMIFFGCVEQVLENSAKNQLLMLK